MNTRLLSYLKDIGLLSQVPDTEPGKGKVLARGVCFLHDNADNPNSFLLYADGFVCFTAHCHREHGLGHNLEGLIRHMVYRVTGEIMSWRAAWDFAKANKPRLKALVENAVRHVIQGSSNRKPVDWTAENLAACLDIPSPYYLDRGYKPETLSHFGVGTCVRQLPDGRNLRGWSIIPVLGPPHQPPYGYTARNPHWNEVSSYPKWLHAVSRRACLFNSWAACRKLWPVIICEGPGCVMRFHEAGFQGAVATLGASLTPEQYGDFLAMYYNQKVFIAADADETGRKFAESLKRRIEGVCLHEPVVLTPPQAKDFGDMTTDQVEQFMVQAGVSRGSERLVAAV